MLADTVTTLPRTGLAQRSINPLTYVSHITEIDLSDTGTCLQYTRARLYSIRRGGLSLRDLFVVGLSLRERFGEECALVESGFKALYVERQDKRSVRQ